LAGIQAHADLRPVVLARPHRAAVEHLPAADATDARHRIGQRVEGQRKRTARHAILAGQRAVGQAVGERGGRNTAVEPVPARAIQLEVGDEVQRHAAVDRVLERPGQVEFELGIDDDPRLGAVGRHGQRGLGDHDPVVGTGRRGRQQQQRHRAANQT